MRYKEFGKTGMQVSEMTLGTWGIGGVGWDDNPKSVRQDAIRAAVEAGVNFFDTAPAYNAGAAERCLGEALADMGVRDKMYISTKCGNVFVDGVTYRDIRIDVALADDPESLFRFVIDDGSGTIRNVRVENVFVNYGGALTGKIQGSTKAKNIDGVTFVNVRNSRGERLSMSHITKNSLVSHLSIQ